MAITAFPVINSTDWYSWAGDVDSAIRIAPTVSADTVAWTGAGTLVAGARNTIDGSGSAYTLVLPAPARQGQTLALERIDTGTNTVTIAAASGATLRGNATATITMPGIGAAFESMLLVAESSTSWFVAAGHKTKTWLDILYALKDATSTVKGGVQLTGDLGGTAASPTVPGLANKANLASPTFTGTPAAPTPATADNSTTVATTGFVKNQGYAPLASPALTGTPTAPTASAGTSTTQVATTAFATSAAAAAQSALVGVNAQTASYTLVLSDAGKLVTETPTAAATVTVPTNASVAFPIGTVISLANLSTYALTLAPASGATLLSPAGLRITTQNAQLSLVKIATDTWLVSGQTVT